MVLAESIELSHINQFTHHAIQLKGINYLTFKATISLSSRKVSSLPVPILIWQL
jgi:hypothetical protein